jgi:hypothetical protein
MVLGQVYGPSLPGLPQRFDTLIQVKVNAVELFRKEIGRLERDVISCGDWQQPAEDRYGLSRAMLEAVRDFSFPLFILEGIVDSGFNAPAILEGLVAHELGHVVHFAWREQASLKQAGLVPGESGLAGGRVSTACRRR